MHKRRKSIAIVIAMIVAIFAIITPSTAEGIVIIVNESNSVSSVSINDLKRIFRGIKKKWKDGSNISYWVPVSGSDPMQALVENIFKFSDEEEINKYYVKAIFQQKITSIPPSDLGSKDAALKVAASKGGIAIVKSSEVSGISGIKVIEVSGL